MCDIIKKAYFSVFDKTGGIARYFPEKKTTTWDFWLARFS